MRSTSCWSYWLLPLIPLWLYAICIVSFGHDDSHITYWAAHSLANSGDIHNYNGERVEQSSSLLLTLWLALWGKLGASIVTVGYLTGFIAANLAIIGTVRGLNPVVGRGPALFTGLALSCSPYFAAWSLSGMETTLAALCALLFLHSCYRLQHETGWRVSVGLLISSVLLLMVRPEMPVVVSIYALSSALLLRRWLLLLPLLLVALLAIWRVYYFGHPFPNPVYAKASGSVMDSVWFGIGYTSRLGAHPLLAAVSWLLALSSLLALVGSFWRARTRPALLLISLWVGIYASFVIASGGDWMREGRFWVPLIAPALLGFTLLWRSWLPAKWGVLPPLLVSVLLALYAPSFIQKFNSGSPLWSQADNRLYASPEASVFEYANREHLRDWPAIRALQQLLRELPQDKPVLLMSKQMGMVVFHLKREFPHLQVMDSAGLVETSLLHCQPLRQRAGFDGQGLRLNYPLFFEWQQTAIRECGLRAPDIIYDLYGWSEATPLPTLLREQGYAIVYQQDGQLKLPLGPQRSAKEVVAIKADLINRAWHSERVYLFEQQRHPAPQLPVIAGDTTPKASMRGQTQ